MDRGSWITHSECVLVRVRLLGVIAPIACPMGGPEEANTSPGRYVADVWCLLLGWVVWALLPTMTTLELWAGYAASAGSPPSLGGRRLTGTTMVRRQPGSPVTPGGRRPRKPRCESCSQSWAIGPARSVPVPVRSPRATARVPTRRPRPLSSAVVHSSSLPRLLITACPTCPSRPACPSVLRRASRRNDARPDTSWRFWHPQMLSLVSRHNSLIGVRSRPPPAG
jgi:hypothetical protein